MPADQLAIEIELATLANAFKLQEYFLAAAISGQLEMFPVPGHARWQIGNAYPEGRVLVPGVRRRHRFPR